MTVALEEAFLNRRKASFVYVIIYQQSYFVTLKLYFE